jgi:hypothetical protein
MTNKKSTRYFSNRQEKRVAKAVGGRKTANSGATMFSKGDVNTSQFLLECKTCVKEQESFTLKREWFEKNEEEAFAMGKDYSAVVFDFGDGVERYIIDENLFKKLVKFLEEE